MARTSAKGMFDDLINVILPELVNAAFDTGGQKCVEALREDAPKDDGRLHGSISYARKGRDARVASPAREGDGAPTPETPFLMYIGTRVPYAWYVEHRSGPHSKGDDSEGFKQRITAWALRHGWDEAQVFFLIRSIRKHGTEAQPFFFEKEAIVNWIIGEELKKALTRMPSEVKRSAPIEINIATNSKR